MYFHLEFLIEWNVILMRKEKKFLDIIGMIGKYKEGFSW